MRDIPEYMHEGVRLLSVTEALGLAGISAYGGGNIPTAVLDKAADRGKRVHYWCELLDQGDIDGLPEEGDEIRPYVESYVKFKKDTAFCPRLIEHPATNILFRYAGTVDRTGLLNGKPVIIDLKTCVALSPVYGPQTAGYAGLVEGGSAMGRYALQLRKDGKYRLEPYSDPSDWNTFLGALSVAQFKTNKLGAIAQ